MRRQPPRTPAHSVDVEREHTDNDTADVQADVKEAVAKAQQVAQPAMRAPSHKGTLNDSSDRSTTYIVAGGALLLVVLGALFIAALYYNKNQVIEAKPYYVSFHDVRVTSATGWMDISFDLAVDESDSAYVIQNKSALNAHLQSSLAKFDPNAFYSRTNKEWLAKKIRSIANQELGDELVDDVYFGSFKIFHMNTADQRLAE